MTKTEQSLDQITASSPYAGRPWLKHYDYHVQPHYNYPRRPLFEILNLAAMEVPEAVACSFLGADLTFWDIKQRADKLATALHRLAIGKGDRVGIMLPNCPQYSIAAFAVFRLGAIVVNVNPLYTPREVGVVANDSGFKLLVTLDALMPVVAAARGNCPTLENVVITSAAGYSPAATAPDVIENTQRLADLLASVDAPDLPVVEINADEDVAVFQYTGGTTGVPKAAMLTHYNLFANVVQSTIWHGATFRRGEGCFLLVIPFFHIYGFTVGMLGGTFMGVRQVLIPKYDVEALLKAVQAYRPTYFPAVPTIYISLLNHPRAKEFGIDRVKAFNSGSAPLPVEVIAQFERMTGGTLSEGYGLSEASPVTHTTAHLARRKPGSIGLPFPDTEIKIVDIETGLNEMPVNEEGELCVAGPQVMKGYWNRPDETAIALRQDAAGKTWLYTGDVARMDEDGYTFIVQRKKDMILVSGFNVYPSEVEGVLFTHPAIMEAAVIGIPDAYRGESVKACVVLKEGATATEDEIIEFCATQLTEYKVPRTVEIRDSLPKTAVGKVLHRVLREEEIVGKNKE